MTKLRILHTTLAVIAIPLTVLALTVALREAHGAVHGDAPPRSTYGHTAVLNSAATKVFTGLLGRNAFAIFNNGPNTIWCGFDSGVLTTTGFPVLTQTMFSVDVVYAGGGDKDFYCLAGTADQSGANDTRWIQVK